jgi:hypothetical protein
MQSCPNEILDQIIYALIGEQRESKWFTRLVHPDVLKLALTSNTLAQATQSHRFRTVILERKKRNDSLAQCVLLKPTLLSQTVDLIWDSQFLDNNNELLEWVSSPTAQPVMTSLTSVSSLHIRGLPLKAAAFVLGYTAPQIFASVLDLRIYPCVMMDHHSDLFAFINLFPHVEILLLKINAESLSWSLRTGVTQPLRITPPTLPHGKPLRAFDLQTNVPHATTSSIFARAQGLIYQMSHWGRLSMLTSLITDARDHEGFILLINHCAGTLKELYIQEPWRPDRIQTTQLQHPVNLPLLRLIHFRDIENLPFPTTTELLEVLIPSCQRDQLNIRFSGRWNSLKYYNQRFGGTRELEWAELDRTLSTSGCRAVHFIVSVFVPGLGFKSLPNRELIESLLPQVHTGGSLSVDFTIQTSRAGYDAVSRMITSQRLELVD